MPVIRNLFSVFSSELIGKVVGFVTTVYLAHVLHPEGFGILSFAAVSAAYFMLPVNFGFNDYGILKVSTDRAKENIQRQVGSLLSLRLAIAAGSFSVLVIFSFLVSRFYQIQSLFLILGLMGFGYAISTEWLLTAIERMEFIGIARILGSLFYLAMIFMLVKSAEDLIPCGIITVGRQLIIAFLTTSFIVWKVGTFRLRIRKQEWNAILRFVLPIGLSSLAAQMYFSADVVILGFLRSPKEVGYYSAALRLVALGISMKILVGQVFYPKIVLYSVSLKDKLRTLALLIEKYCILIALLLGFLGSFFGEDIIELIYGIDFSPSIFPFQIAMWVVAIEFIGIVFPYIVLATNRTLYAKIIGSTVAANIFMNLILIPILGAIGAAISYVGSSLFLFGFCYYYVQKRVISIDIGRFFLKPLIASVIMMIVVFIFRSIHVLFLIFPAALLYFIVLMVLGNTPFAIRSDLKALQ